jgi:ribosome-binding factor A
LTFEQALYGPDEGASKPFDPRADRKTLQLCRQVHRALMLALAGECGDEVLRDIYVDAVEPMGSASQLIVRIGLPRSIRSSMTEVFARLTERTPRLRAAVAAAICRKRVPMLSFILVPSIDPAGKGDVDERA